MRIGQLGHRWYWSFLMEAIIDAQWQFVDTFGTQYKSKLKQ